MRMATWTVFPHYGKIETGCPWKNRKAYRDKIDELDKMAQIRDIHLFRPYYPKAIADSWDHSNPLAIRLLELSGLYRNL